MALDQVDGQDLGALLSLRAFHLLCAKRKDSGDPNHLWLKLDPGFLSHAVINVLQKVVDEAYPTTPVCDHPKVGTHNLRKFAYSFA